MVSQEMCTYIIFEHRHADAVSMFQSDMCTKRLQRFGINGVSQEQPGTARSSQEQPGAARSSQEQPGAARRETDNNKEMLVRYPIRLDYTCVRLVFYM